ncbi:MAG TPA: sigma-70 family RNA polymerase sigma factor [Magnetospirillaceae bacterium]|jgi:RNA polymerase sigma-70 factor (ECF subfamily)
MAPQSAHEAFEAAVLPHLDAAYNLARWLMRSGNDAEDVVQEAMVRALTYFPSFRGTNPRGWLLQIVRNAAFASMKLNRGTMSVSVDSPQIDPAALTDPGDDPEVSLMKRQDRGRVTQAIGALEVELREILVLRELQELSYKEIAQITGTPIGTVMSRLWRARRILAATLKAAEAAS